MKIDKFKFTKWLKHLLDIAFGKIKMQGTNIEPVKEQWIRGKRANIKPASNLLHSASVRSAYSWRKIKIAVEVMREA